METCKVVNTTENHIKYKVIKVVGITFYGGLIGAVISLWCALKISKKKTQYSTKEWFDILSPPLVLLHFFGRWGCFWGGCCYGKPTESIFGMKFPDNLENGINDMPDIKKNHLTLLYENL
jgi:phosphatidylglycerol:prolipoprotein diacylglycerol transferase